jgi:hypothetical protein
MSFSGSRIATSFSARLRCSRGREAVPCLAHEAVLDPRLRGHLVRRRCLGICVRVCGRAARNAGRSRREEQGDPQHPGAREVDTAADLSRVPRRQVAETAGRPGQVRRPGPPTAAGRGRRDLPQGTGGLFSCACDEAPHPSRAADATDIDDPSDHDHDDDRASSASQHACDLLSSWASSSARARACDQEITTVGGPSDLTRSIASPPKTPAGPNTKHD